MASATEQSFSLDEFARELAQGRAGWVLFADDMQGRGLLEILWLKLGVLREVLRFAPDVSNVRVQVSTRESHIPAAWSFHVVRSPDAAPRGDGRGDGIDLARAWFGVLLSNENQDVTRVIGMLESALATSADHAARLGAVAKLPQFSAQNIIWRPGSGARVLPSAAIWSAVLDIGVRLSASSVADAPAIVSRAIADIGVLVTQVRQSLLMDPPQMRREIADVLSELISDPQWLQAQAMPAAVSPLRESASRASGASVPDTREDAESTVIIKRGASTAQPAPPRTQSTSVDLDATVIVGRTERGAVDTVQPRNPVPTRENLDETVILSKRDAVPSGSPGAPGLPPENLEETIIVPRDKKR